MSEHDQAVHVHDEHGTVWSYVVGFGLSLVCTLIPYYLVTRKTLGGSQWLLKTILAFAFIQVVIQVVFFLHIGRGPKPRWNLYFFVATLVIVGMVVGGSVLIINNLHYNMAPQDATKKLVNDEGIAQVGGTATGACDELGENHIVTIIDGKATPASTEAGKCDTLTFINKDTAERQITFGVYPAQTPYAGESDFPLTNRKNFTITLSDTGTFYFYDTSQPNTRGTFTVSE